MASLAQILKIVIIKVCNIYITTETKASAKFQDNSDNEHAQWDFYFIFNSKGPTYLRFIILDEDLSNLCHEMRVETHIRYLPHVNHVFSRKIHQKCFPSSPTTFTQRENVDSDYRDTLSKGLNIYSHIFVAFSLPSSQITGLA